MRLKFLIFFILVIAKLQHFFNFAFEKFTDFPASLVPIALFNFSLKFAFEECTDIPTSPIPSVVKIKEVNKTT